ncbi:TonB-dependent receptor domain-containing protein [Cognatiluteimonas telluris]|uniref:TonB-dependent receptor domain-containing protein n=1 Tax=Cognatiluteimonas telluris TaxID=1104775 RepID=UPI001409EEFC|nr:TonB-dependent receptor [Lysobacter telluris]
MNLSLLLLLPGLAAAQDAPPPVAPETATSATTLDRVEVTGSRIKQSDAVTSQPVAIISRAQIDQSGATSIGEFLQDMTASGKALNAKFNSSGNFGYPSDGGGIGAGSAQVDLRNLGSNRVLVLVDGVRWVNESSASGVSGSADLNTIPLAIVDRIEVLEDGASAIYGSDAIAGVVNIITRKKFEGAVVHTKFGSYGHGGDDVEADVTAGTSGDRFNGVFSASYVKSKAISASEWARSSVPTPGGGPAGSSGTPQGRFIFCDPGITTPGTPGFCDPDTADWFDMTLNDGTTTPNYNGGAPTGPGGTYHGFNFTADGFNFAPYNLLLTPSQRTSIFGSASFAISDSVSLHGKVLFNNRKSTNQAAPEPIFVGPFAGTGGIADTISIAANNPYNPFGIDLCAVASPTCGDGTANFGFITKRPIELGPRIFKQDVSTWYFNVGIDGSNDWGPRGMDWNIDAVHSENQADQHFTNGFNVAKLKLALGDVNVCNATPGCVPLDLFGGEGRPITPEMFGYVTAPQHDSSKQVLDLVTANLTGDLWQMGSDRYAGFAVGFEHRRYEGDFTPDPLRQSGESQDSFAAPVSASYHVNEAYAEVLVPWLSSFSTDFALRRSQYSTFGGATTGKAGFRWQPMEDLVVRGTWSEGFRAPNLGELYGLTQFGDTLVDPCGSATHPGPIDPSFAAACGAQGIPTTFTQANTQIIKFTGGNPDLQPERSKNYSFGAVWSPSWAENLSWSRRMDFEFDYYHYKVTDAIQAPDTQALLNGCYDGSITGTACSGFTRGAGFQLNPPTDFLDNLGTITTSGIDFKTTWLSPELSWGQLSASLQSTHTLKYDAVDDEGNHAQRTVGLEVADSAIPDWQTNVQLGWHKADWNASWNVRYISAVDEDCGNAGTTPSTGCVNPVGLHELPATTYHDVQVGWSNAFGAQGLKVALGVNNLFDKEPPVCVTCSLNGYDAGTYDLPFRFWYMDLQYKF